MDDLYAFLIMAGCFALIFVLRWTFGRI